MRPISVIPLQLLLTVSLTVLSSSVAAQSYVGIAAGKISSSLQCKNNCQTSVANIKLTAGVDLGSNWSLESQLHIASNMKGTFDRINAKTDSSISHKGIDLAALCRWRLNDKFALFSRTGIAFTSSEVKNPAADSSSTTRYSAVKPVIGAGLVYAITPLTYLRGDLDLRQARSDGSNSNITGLSLGIQSAF
ncbi:outer membrane beta-barrel protein [Undibacterium rugosum]|uniref:Outer membrane beta-barrel protein n=1 Tax=Undibacterium rugosum TaxID=2762291 RepID=A0A923I1D1_9BURK|nr:outer membrane beta-barrel protein [Undibacterium rugosum]MBC3934570.1 outer membrane beta-barrel protein [Undibacterium rugosum]MBR7777184.1 outer membrane beta-barrel protein [Undibacterium rugosum]